MGGVAGCPKHCLRKRSQLEIIKVDAKVAMTSANFTTAVLLAVFISVLSDVPALCQDTSRTELPPGVTVLKVKWETQANVSTADGPPGASADPNLNRLPLPSQSTTTTIVRTQLYVYSMELSNNGPKTIKALAWDFIFADAANKMELKRQSLANLQTIGTNQKKTIRFTTQAAPPKLVSAGALEKDKRSPFIQSANIRCLLFTDDSVWEQSKAKGACSELRQWIERRKKSPLGIEDLPLKN